MGELTHTITVRAEPVPPVARLGEGDGVKVQLGDKHRPLRVDPRSAGTPQRVVADQPEQRRVEVIADAEDPAPEKFREHDLCHPATPTSVGR